MEQCVRTCAGRARWGDSVNRIGSGGGQLAESARQVRVYLLQRAQLPYVLRDNAAVAAYADGGLQRHHGAL